MKIRELIEQLKAFDPEMLVVKRRHSIQGEPVWDTMDGHWFEGVVVEKREILGQTYYVEARSWSEAEGIDAIEL